MNSCQVPRGLTVGNVTINGFAPPVVIAPEIKPSSADPLATLYEIPCALVLESAVPGFSVGSLMKLQPGAVLRTSAQQNEDLILKVNGQVVGTVEVDVIGNTLAVRITGMA